MTQESWYDVAVIGAGVYGLSIAKAAVGAGRRVLLVDQSDPLKAKNSSQGTTRIFRRTAVESAEYMQYSDRAYDIWQSYQAEAGGSLLHETGFVLAADPETGEQSHHGVSDLVTKAQQLARDHGITHEVLDGSRLHDRFPDLAIAPNAAVFCEPGALVLRADIAIDLIYDKLRNSSSVDIVIGRPVTACSPYQRGVRLTVDGNEQFYARSAVLATGPWQHERILGFNPVPAAIFAQLPMTVKDPAGRLEFPCFAYVRRDSKLIYGVPPVGGLGEFKVGLEQDDFKADGVNSERDFTELASSVGSRTLEALLSVLPAADTQNVTLDLCYYTVTQDSRHVVRHVWDGRVTVVSACSGHGFKYAPAFAEQVYLTVESIIG